MKKDKERREGGRDVGKKERVEVGKKERKKGCGGERRKEG